jgi:hypothetical protein
MVVGSQPVSPCAAIVGRAPMPPHRRDTVPVSLYAHETTLAFTFSNKFRFTPKTQKPIQTIAPHTINSKINAVNGAGHGHRVPTTALKSYTFDVFVPPLRGIKIY